MSLKRVNVSSQIVVDTCHCIELRDSPVFFKRVQEQGIFKGAVVHVCRQALYEAHKIRREAFEAIRARHEALGAAKTIFVELTPEMYDDADVLLSRHGGIGLHPPDNLYLSYAKNSGCDLCTLDGDLSKAALAEGVPCIDPSKLHGTAGHLYAHLPSEHPGVWPACPAHRSVSPPGKSRRRLPRRACPDPSDPRFRQVSGCPELRKTRVKSS